MCFPSHNAPFSCPPLEDVSLWPWRQLLNEIGIWEDLHGRCVSGHWADATKAEERWGVVSEVIPWHSCGVVCGCVVKRGPISWQPWKAGLGFGDALGVKGCPFHHVPSLSTLLPAC